MTSTNSFKLVAIVVCLLLSTSSYSQKTVTISIDRQLNPPLMGYNSDMSNTPKWSNPDFSKALNDLDVNTLRYPGGSNSLYWDWEKGWTISYEQLIPFLQKYNITYENKSITDPKELKIIAKENRTKNSFWRQIYRYNSKTPKFNTIDEFAKGIKATQSTAVITLNITTSFLEKELRMLQEARKKGIDVQYIELGNEIYANNLLTSAAYPSVDNYIDTCIAWSEAIWKEFPSANIGVVGGDRNKRTRHWNQALSDALKQHFSTEKLSYFHFILHYYSYFKHPIYPFNTQEGYKKLVAFPKMDLQEILTNTRWYKTNHFNTWVTEYNIIEQKPYTINNRWIHGLVVASQIDQLIKQTQTDMFHFHSIGAETFPVFAALQLMKKDTAYLTPTTSGIVTKTWNRFTQNATEFYSTTNNYNQWELTYVKRHQQLPNNPRNETTISFQPVHAYLSYDQDKKAKLLVVNLTSEKLKLTSNDIITKGQHHQFFESPSEKNTKSISVNFEGPITLLPYSLNLLEE